jgi:hypothetical protein
MKKCPRCNQYTIALDSYRGVYECTSDECTCIAVSEGTYSYIKNNPITNKIDIVEVKDGNEEVIKSYSKLLNDDAHKFTTSKTKDLSKKEMSK